MSGTLPPYKFEWDVTPEYLYAAAGGLTRTGLSAIGVVAALFVAVALIFDLFGEPAVARPLTFLGAAWVALFFGSIALMVYFRRRVTRVNEAFLGSRAELSLADDGIAIRFPGQEARLQWWLVRGVKTTPLGVRIRTGRRAALFVPNEAMDPPERRAQFLAYVADRIVNARETHP